MTIYNVRLHSDQDSIYFRFIDYGELIGFVGQVLENKSPDNDDLEVIISTEYVKEVGLDG